MSKCRCGWEGEGQHPCHGKGYQCKSPALPRFVATSGGLSGSQIKTAAYQTWACDSCWEEFREFAKKEGE